MRGGAGSLPRSGAGATRRRAYGSGRPAGRGSLFATRPSLADYTRTRGELRRAAAALFTVVQQGAVRARIDRRLPLREAAAAHRLLEAGATSGAIVLEP